LALPEKNIPASAVAFAGLSAGAISANAPSFINSPVVET
jgi:hypothetical protein